MGAQPIACPAAEPPAHDFAARLSAPDSRDLLVAVAHDLRSPLTSILFLAEQLGAGRSGAVNDLQRRQLPRTSLEI